jgi:tetratricopeptide (TPR) repeat protein
MTADQHAPTPPADASPEAPESLRQRWGGHAWRIASWATATRLRIVFACTAGLLALACVFASWSYMAHLAVEAIEPVTLDGAIAALDQGRFDDAAAMIGDMHRMPASQELLGGAMFVLGAIKAHEAEQDSSPERQRAVHQLAAKYLTKARALGVPAGREGEAAYLVGKSFVEAGGARHGVAPLEEALEDQSLPSLEIHQLLARAFMEVPEPSFPAALRHIDVVLAEKGLPNDEREQFALLRAEALLRMQQTDQARAIIDQLPQGGVLASRRWLLLGRLEIEEANQLAEDKEAREAKVRSALASLRKAARIDASATSVTRQAIYWMARCHEMRGDDDAALAQYGRLHRVYGETPEGLAARFSEADCHRRAGEIERALAGYRAVLESVGDPELYDNPLLSLGDLKQQITKVYQRLIRDEFFEEALELVELCEPVFGRATCVEWSAKTRQLWGQYLLELSQNQWTESESQRLGRAQLRAAGSDFEQLAGLRRASRSYTDDLWAAAECYFDGQSFSNAARLFEEYLHHEARYRNARALLRLGQSRLARGELSPAVSAFEECVELYPRDAVVYQARLECARAQHRLGNFEKAESLLTTNLWSEGLTPGSPEWRDSKFALGSLLYDCERYDECIAALDEAVRRYPEEEAALMAKYTMARAFHAAAETPAIRQREAKTENERQKNRLLAADYLNRAHGAYQDVQRTITLRGLESGDELDRALLRNCYMMQGAVLFELRRFEEARQAYGNVITLYRDDPIVLESFVQVANCWRRLSQPMKARATLDQAKMVLQQLPKEADFQASTNFSRQQWELLLSQMSKW